MKNAFYRLLTRHDRVKERINVHEDMSIETPHTVKKKYIFEEKEKIWELRDDITRYIIEYQKERQARMERSIWSNNVENFLNLMSDTESQIHMVSKQQAE